jgi:transcriptional regulator of heat shock response
MKVRYYQAGLAFVFLIVLSGTLPLMALSPAARDYLTPQEEERVKEAQVLDKRIEVFVKAAERRMLVLTDPSSKQVQKDLEKWGELPKGTRVELIMDISNILDAAVTNIDDVAVRDENNRLLPKALRKLAEAATRFQTQLLAMREQIKEGQERAALERVMENVEEILEAANKLPPAPEKK